MTSEPAKNIGGQIHHISRQKYRGCPAKPKLPTALALTGPQITPSNIAAPSFVQSRQAPASMQLVSALRLRLQIRATTTVIAACPSPWRQRAFVHPKRARAS